MLKFSKPTAAEAILAAMDADLKAHEAKQSDSGHEYEGYRLEDLYIDALVDLGDKRLAAEAARRSQAADTVRLRRKWAYSAHWLGDPEPFKKFAADLSKGKIQPHANEEAMTYQIREIGRNLIATGQSRIVVSSPIVAKTRPSEENSSAGLP